jgi:hypothetical protein
LLSQLNLRLEIEQQRDNRTKIIVRQIRLRGIIGRAFSAGRDRISGKVSRRKGSAAGLQRHPRGLVGAGPIVQRPSSAMEVS